MLKHPQCGIIQCDKPVTSSVSVLRKYETFTVDASVRAIMVTKGKFELINPKDRRFGPLEPLIDVTEPYLLLATEDGENALTIVHEVPPFVQRAPSTEEEGEEDEEEPTVSTSSSEVVYPKPVKRKLVPDPKELLLEKRQMNEEELAKRRATREGVKRAYLHSLVDKATRDLAGAQLQFTMNQVPFTTTIARVVANYRGNLALQVNVPDGGDPMFVSDWIRPRFGAQAADSHWWTMATVKRGDKEPVLLASIIPWPVKTLESEREIKKFMDTPFSL